MIWESSEYLQPTGRIPTNRQEVRKENFKKQSRQWCQISQRNQVRKNLLSAGFSNEEVIGDFRISRFCGSVGVEAKSYMMEDWMNRKEVARLNGGDSRNLDKKRKKKSSDSWRRHAGWWEFCLLFCRFEETWTWLSHDEKKPERGRNWRNRRTNKSLREKIPGWKWGRVNSGAPWWDWPWRHQGKKDMGAGKLVNEGWGPEGSHASSSQFYQLKKVGIPEMGWGAWGKWQKFGPSLEKRENRKLTRETDKVG